MSEYVRAIVAGKSIKPSFLQSLPQVDIPLDATTLQLERLVNQLLGNDEKVPYAFYVDPEIAKNADASHVGIKVRLFAQ